MDIIDQLLKDLRPSDSDAGLQRGQKIDAITDAEDQGILEELAPGGEHTNANPGQGSGIVAAAEDWQQNAAKPFTREDSVMNDVLKHASGETQTGGRSTLADTVVKAHIATLLHLGYTPKQVTAKLEKLAEAQVFNREVAAEFLNDQSGLVGMAYIEPNHFNQKSCVASLNHIRQNGILRAASVKRIAACEGCDNCKSDHAGGCKCATYGLPIVSNAKELGRVVASIAGPTPKKATLVQKHNRETQVMPGHTVNVIARTEERNPNLKVAGDGGVTVFDINKVKEAASEFTPKAVRASVDGGKTLQEVYVSAKKAYGSAKTERVVRAYLDSLKKTGSRINLAAVDCSLLKGRLTASETILGKDKCASCGLRSGMHCGFTGGTLLSFPGMEKTSSKTASAQGQDGVAFMQSLELTAPTLEIQINKDRELPHVEMDVVPTVRF